MKLIFMGTPDFALPSLRKIHSSEHHLAGVVTQPDRPRGRGRDLIPSPVKRFALDNNIPHIWQPESLKDPVFYQSLQAAKADVFVVVAFRILPEELFSMPPLGTINVHPSLLPLYRGAAPINWAIIRGETETGVTIIQLTKQIDAGGILMQKRVFIQENETAGELHDRLASLGADLLLQSLNNLEAGTIQVTPQKNELATPAPKLTRDDCHISFRKPAEKVKNWIHGLSPYPTAFSYLGDQRINFYRAEAISRDKVSEIPGTVILKQRENLWIACDPGIVSILELQKEGKRRMSAAEFIRGFQISAGDRFR